MHIDAGSPKRGRSGKLCWQAQAKTVEEDHALHWDIATQRSTHRGNFSATVTESGRYSNGGMLHRATSAVLAT